MSGLPPPEVVSNDSMSRLHCLLMAIFTNLPESWFTFCLLCFSFFSCPDFVWDSSIPTPVTHYRPTYLPTRRFYFLTHRVTLEPCDLWDIRSEWWGDIQRVTQETYDFWDIWSGWWWDMTWPWPGHDPTMTWPWPDHDLTKTILVTFDIWDTDYTESMTIFVTWQLRVTLDSIRNSCDVYIMSASLASCFSHSALILLARVPLPLEFVFFFVLVYACCICFCICIFICFYIMSALLASCFTHSALILLSSVPLPLVLVLLHNIIILSVVMWYCVAWHHNRTLANLAFCCHQLLQSQPQGDKPFSTRSWGWKREIR